jgi:hypothetical protein
MTTPHPKTARTRLRLVASLGAAAVLTGALSAVGTAGTAEAATPQAVKNTTFEDGTSHWSKTANVKAKRVKSAGRYTLVLTPKKRSGAKVIVLRSRSGDRLPQGTYVHSTAQVRTSQPGKRSRLTMIMREVGSDGRTIKMWTDARKKVSTKYLPLGAHLTTSQPNSRVTVEFRATNIRKKNTVSVKQDVTTPAVSAPAAPGQVKPTPTKPTSPPATGVPGVPSTPDTRACEDINYKDPKQGTQTYADEFNGTTLDPTQWRTRTNTYLDFDGAWITKDNVSVHDGSLDIMGKRLPESKWQTVANPRYGDENRVRKYSTGYIDSIKDAGYTNAANAKRFSQRYGHFEARAWVPSTNVMSRGVWPAFWLRADTKNGEIDPMESYGGPTIKNYDPSNSYEWNSWEDTAQQFSKAHIQGTANVGTDKIHQGWHTFAVNWSPTCMRYMYDGKTVGVVPIDGTNYMDKDSFNSPFHIRLNMQIGSKYWGWADLEHTRDEFHYLVDYVRVYAKK